MWAGLRVEISCFSTTSTDALNMVGTAVQPVIIMIVSNARTNDEVKKHICGFEMCADFILKLRSAYG